MQQRAYETISLARLRMVSAVLGAISFGAWALAAVFAMVGAKGIAQGLAVAFVIAGLLACLTGMFYGAAIAPRWCRHVLSRIRAFLEN